MSKDKKPQVPDENDNNKDVNHFSEQDIKKEISDKELNRRKALKTILGASSLLVINPFSMSAKSTGLLVTVTPSSSQAPTPTPTNSVTPTSSRTPTPTPTSSVTPTSSQTPTPTSSATPTSSQTPTPTSSVTPTSTQQEPTPTPTSSATPTSSQTPTPTNSVTPTSTQQEPTPTPTSSATPTSSQTPTPTSSVTPTSTQQEPTPTPTSSITPSTSLTPTPTPTSSPFGSILPVELSEFGVREEDDVIKLYWKTENEINNKGFEIQRSSNSFTFNKIGWVDGAGNSNHSISYGFEELNVESNQWYYYRLKQIDFNGTSEYSKTIAIMINEKNKTKVKDISPNIVTDNHVNIEISAGIADTAEIFIHHINGQLIATKKVIIDQGNNTIKMNLRNTASGMCVVNVKFGKGKSQTKRFIVKR